MYPKTFLDYFREFERTNEVFVAMPFADPFSRSWKNIIRPAIKKAKLDPYRVDMKKASDSILIDIFEGIGRAKLILVDISSVNKASRISGPNPNVMYELGIAHAVRLPEEVIVIKDKSSSDSPQFDIAHIRRHTFDTEKINASISLVVGLLKDANKTIEVTRDKIVKKVFNSLDPDELCFLGTIGALNYFDFYPFDPDRKGLYGLGQRDSSHVELRQIARELIKLGLLKAGEPGPPEKQVYGTVKEYEVTSLGKAVWEIIPQWAKKKEGGQGSYPRKMVRRKC